MPVAFLAAALLAQAAPLRREYTPPTARQLYDSCAVYLRDLARLPQHASPPTSDCETASLTVALTIRGTAAGPNPSGNYCPPRTSGGPGRAHARDEAEAYLAFVDRYPQAKEHPDGLLVFVNAMIRQWPCPR